MDPLDETVGQMLAPGQARLADLGAAIRGVSAMASTAFDEFRLIAAGLHATGHDAARNIKSIEADSALPMEHRRDQARQIRETAEQMLRKGHQGAQSKVAVIESALQDACLPTPPVDASSRLLARDELRTRFSGLRGTDLSAAVIRNLGRDSRTDGEMLSSFGEAMFAGAGAADHFKSVRAAAIETYSKPMPGMSQRQVAAVRAYGVFKAANLSGVAAAHHAAGTMRLRADVPLPARRSA